MKQKILITAFIAVLLILGIIFFWLPEYNRFNNLRNQIEEKKIQVADKKQYFLELENTLLELEKYNLELSRIVSALPEAPEIPSLFYFLERKSAESGLILEKISLKEASALGAGDTSLSPPLDGVQEIEKSGIQKTSIEISLFGSYQSFKNFLSIIEKSDRLIGVESISFSAPEDEEDLFGFNLIIKAYSY